MTSTMKQQTIFQEPEKAKMYIQLQDQGMSKMQATYIAFGTKIGDEMVRMRQHEIILEKPIFN